MHTFSTNVSPSYGILSSCIISSFEKVYIRNILGCNTVNRCAHLFCTRKIALIAYIAILCTSIAVVQPKLYLVVLLFAFRSKNWPIHFEQNENVIERSELVWMWMWMCVSLHSCPCALDVWLYLVHECTRVVPNGFTTIWLHNYKLLLLF